SCLDSTSLCILISLGFLRLLFQGLSQGRGLVLLPLYPLALQVLHPSRSSPKSLFCHPVLYLSQFYSQRFDYTLFVPKYQSKRGFILVQVARSLRQERPMGGVSRLGFEGQTVG